MERLQQHEVDTTIDLLTVKEVAWRLRVDDTTVRRWIKNGSLAALVLPKSMGQQRQSYRVEKSTLEGLSSSLLNATEV